MTTSVSVRLAMKEKTVKPVGGISHQLECLTSESTSQRANKNFELYLESVCEMNVHNMWCS